MMRYFPCVLMIGLVGCGEDSKPIAADQIQLVHFEAKATPKETPIDPKVAIAKASLLRPNDLSARFALVRIGMDEATVFAIMGPPHRAELPEALVWSEPEPNGGLGYNPGQDHYRLGIRNGKVYCKQAETTGRGLFICGNDIQFERGFMPQNIPNRAPAPAPRKPCGGKRR